MALSDYIESLKEEPDTREVPFAKKYPPVARSLPKFTSIPITSASGGRHRQGMILPEEEKKEEGGPTPADAWDIYQQIQKNRAKGQTPQSTPSAEPASSSTQTPAATQARPVVTHGHAPVSGAPAAAPASSGPVQGMAGGPATYSAAYPQTMATGTAPYGSTMATGSTPATTASGSGAGGSMAGSTGAIALYAILGSLGQKWATKEQMSDDPDRGPTSRKARVFSALAPSAMHAIKDPGGEGIYQLTGHSPVMSLLGKGQGGKGETESEGYKIWKWIGKLFD